MNTGGDNMVPEMDEFPPARMSGYRAMAVAYGMFDPGDDESVIIEAYQTLIDTGYIWTMPGHYGRVAQHYIDEGLCHV